MIKTNRKEWDAFLASWPTERYYDDAVVTINSVAEEQVAPEKFSSIDALIEVSGGVILDPNDRDVSLGLEREFKKWRTKQSSVFVLCQVPADKTEELKKLLKTIGGKVAK